MDSHSLEKLADEGAKKPPGCWGARYTFAVLSFLGMAIAFIIRVDLSVAIVAMVVKNHTVSNANNSDVQCPGLSNDGEDEASSGEFDWDATIQGWILGGFSIGYITTQIVGGMLCEKYGGKWFFGGGIFAASLFGLLSPIAAKTSPYLLITVRAFQGAFIGPLFPGILCMGSRWFPVQEKNKLMTFVQAGSQVGTIIGFPLGGILASSLGWETVFYASGAFGCVWFIFYAFFVFSTPQDHPRISESEKNYILANVVSTKDRSQLPPPPFLQIITTPAIWAFICAHISNAWGYYTLMTSTPSYLNNIQQFSLESNGFLSAFPHLLLYLFSFVVGISADKLLNKKILTVVQIRKIYNSVAQYGGAIGCIILAFAGCNRVMAIAAMSMAVGLNAAAYAGYFLVPGEMSPNYSATVLGISQTVANTSGFISPVVTGAIINGQQTIEQWRKVFLLSAIVYVVGNTIFVVFGKSEIQSWNTYWEKKEGVEEGVRADGGKDEQRRASGDDQLKRRGSVRSMSSASDTGSKSISEQE